MAQLVIAEAERLCGLALVETVAGQRLFEDRLLMRIDRAAQELGLSYRATERANLLVTILGRLYVELITDGQGYSATRVEFQITRWLSLLSTVSTIGRQSVGARISKDY